MSESELLAILFGTGAFLFFLLVIMLLISVFKVSGIPRVGRSVRDEVRKIKEQIENPEE